jgi:Carboxypeptidase regulatory-like domain
MYSRRAVLPLLIASSIAFGQDMSPPTIPDPGQNKLPPNTRVIEGVVVDAQGAPVPNAIVLLKDTKTLQIRSYLAQQDGNYHFFGLSTDVNYQVRAHNGEMTSPWKLVSVFNSRDHVKIELKLKKKIGSDKS